MDDECRRVKRQLTKLLSDPDIRSVASMSINDVPSGPELVLTCTVDATFEGKHLRGELVLANVPPCVLDLPNTADVLQGAYQLMAGTITRKMQETLAMMMNAPEEEA